MSKIVGQATGQVCFLWLDDDGRRVNWLVAEDVDGGDQAPLAQGLARNSATLRQEVRSEGWELAERCYWEPNDDIDGWTVPASRRHVTAVPLACSCGASKFPTVLALLLHQSSGNGTGHAR
jgi:hypothetical protein